MIVISDIINVIGYVFIGCLMYAALTLGLGKLMTSNDDDWMIVAYVLGELLFIIVTAILLFGNINMRA